MIWGFFIHANARWRFGPLEWLIATPAFHHWHHTNDGPAYVNKNYAALLPLVDRLFGTLYLPKDKQPEHYGIDEPLPSGFLGQLVRPFLISPGRTQPAAADPTPVGPLSPDRPLTQLDGHRPYFPLLPSFECRRRVFFDRHLGSFFPTCLHGFWLRSPQMIRASLTSHLSRCTQP